MKKILALLLAVALIVVCFAGCGEQKETTLLEKIKAAGVLNLATESGFAPYEFIYNNEVVGVDINLMKAIADEIGVTLKINDMEFKNVVASVQTGKMDAAAAGITINEDRKKEVDFSKPYASTEQYVVVLADAEMPAMEALAGKKIGVQEGTTSDMLITDLIADGTLAGTTASPYANAVVAADSLGAKVDAVVVDKLTAENIVTASNGKYKTAKLLKADGTEVAEVEEYGVAVAKGNEDLLEVINKVIDKLLEDGSITKWTEEFTEMAKLVE